jgi:hypothetical protein
LNAKIRWPDEKRFAFTIFDDPDSQSLEDGREVYALLRDLGFLTTKGAWPVRGPRTPSDNGGTCDEPEYRDWCFELQASGFEIGWHNATLHTSTRQETAAALERFRELFGHYPSAMANHYFCDEAIYWDENRTSGSRRRIYELATRYRHSGRSQGHVATSPLFWGDLCAQHLRYVRNFTFSNIDTLDACPWMPYRDPSRPFVQAWFASSDGNRASRFLNLLAEANQDRLADAGGCCIVYVHFGHGFVQDGKPITRFVQLMRRLASLGGWYAPVTRVLDHIRDTQGVTTLDDAARAALEWRWLVGRILHGAS